MLMEVSKVSSNVNVSDSHPMKQLKTHTTARPGEWTPNDVRYRVENLGQHDLQDLAEEM